MHLADVPAFSKIRIADFGSFEQSVDTAVEIDEVVTVWTQSENDGNAFATIRMRGLVESSGELVWLPTDAQVAIVEPPRYAGQPEDLILEATPIAAPAGSKGSVASSEGWPALIWGSDLVFSPVQGWTDPELAVEILLCALAVAPTHDPDLRPMLLAGLKARYAHLQSKPKTYVPDTYPWKDRTGPNEDMIDYLSN